MSTLIDLDEISTVIWKRLVHCTFLILCVISIAALRLAYLTDSNKDIHLEMTIWRIGLLLAFQTAPLQWAKYIYKIYKNRRTSAPLYQTMELLRIPVAIWTGGCLTTALVLWPILGGA